MKNKTHTTAGRKVWSKLIAADIALTESDVTGLRNACSLTLDHILYGTLSSHFPCRPVGPTINVAVTSAAGKTAAFNNLAAKLDVKPLGECPTPACSAGAARAPAANGTQALPAAAAAVAAPAAAAAPSPAAAAAPARSGAAAAAVPVGLAVLCVVLTALGF